jgi:pimeloyl-ACP methyl ester carboxylesterase
MDFVQSQDGTRISVERSGSGPAVVLVSGGSVDRTSNAPLAVLLAEQFTVYNYDRRGRGESGDTPPYAVQREIEDIAAVMQAAGGAAYLYGSSSGAALALHAAAAGVPVIRLALWEPPFIGDGFPRPPANTAQVFTDLVAAGRRGDAAEFFMTQVVGLPAEFVAQARAQPWWAAQEALAHTLAYDAAIMGDYWLPREAAAAVAVPALVLHGGASMPFMASMAAELTAALPHGEARLLPDQPHNVDAAVLAPALIEFFNR